jgi:purine-binding chemotaxis protein CheW
VSLAADREAPASAPAQAGAIHQYLSFRLDGHLYAVPLGQVAEITPFRELNRIPHMPRSVEGLLNHRGLVIPVISLRSRMNLTPQDASLSANIILLDLGGSSLAGILVDAVDSVVSAVAEQLVPASPLLAGPEGAWVRGFILQGEERIIALLDIGFIAAVHGASSNLGTTLVRDKGRLLDDQLRSLIELAPPKVQADRTRIIPQMEEAIAHTEGEMAKVIACVETMLDGSDKALQALVRLKQEAALGRLKGEEKTIAEMERLCSQVQDGVFDLLQQLQYQDITRQKLERVLTHVRGLQMVVGVKLRDKGRLPGAPTSLV